MSYFLQSKMAEDSYLLERVVACAANLSVENPREWAVRNMITLTGSVEWQTAYQPKFNTSAYIANPAGYVLTGGADENAVTDEMIKTGVQLLLQPATPDHTITDDIGDTIPHPETTPDTEVPPPPTTPNQTPPATNQPAPPPAQ